MFVLWYKTQSTMLEQKFEFQMRVLIPDEFNFDFLNLTWRYV